MPLAARQNEGHISLPPSAHLRYRELDALRGLAALSVVFFHYLSCFNLLGNSGSDGQLNQIFNAINFSVFHILFAGSEAVIFFFVLSGFVLYLAVDRFDARGWAAFGVQRMCRIYIPFIVAAGIGLLLNYCFRFDRVPELSNEYFNAHWSRAPGIRDVLQHLFFVFGYDEMVSDGPTWSLLHEIRFSLVFPLVVLLVDRTRWYNALIGSLALSFAFAYLQKITHGIYNIFGTLMFTNEFVTGAILARHRTSVVEFFRRSRPTTKTTVLAAGILCYTYAWWFLPGIKMFHRVPFNNFVVTAGAAMIMVYSLSSYRASAILLRPGMQMLGKLSYSIYLYHFIVILIAFHLFYDVSGQNGWFMFLPVLVITLAAAALSQRFMERPAMIAGKVLGLRIREEGSQFLINQKI
jgi:peptidoglycan/LPS O-acetylase OafA/YrhL